MTAQVRRVEGPAEESNGVFVSTLSPLLTTRLRMGQISPASRQSNRGRSTQADEEALARPRIRNRRMEAIRTVRRGADAAVATRSTDFGGVLHSGLRSPQENSADHHGSTSLEWLDGGKRGVKFLLAKHAIGENVARIQRSDFARQTRRRQ